MQEFIDLVQAAFFAQDNNKRGLAEQGLITMKQQAPNDFFQKCSTTFIAPQLDSQIRVAAGTLLKRCIYYEQGWLVVGLDVKRKIKDELLSQLISSDQNIKKSAASCISGICAIELPRKEWPEIISILVQNTTHEQLEIRKAATITLGYICEALKNQKQSIAQTEGEKVLYGICLGLQGEKEIRLISIRALQDSLQFMDQLLAQQNIRDHVTKLLIDSAISPDQDIRLGALQCLIDYTKAIFDYLDQYIQAIWNCTSESLFKQDFAIAAMEIWQCISAEVNERQSSSRRTNLGLRKTQKESLQLVAEQLVQAVLQNLIITDFDEEDDEEQSIQEASYKAASSISEALGNQCYRIFLLFVQNTLNSPELQNRKASLLAFSAMVETSDINELSAYSSSALGEFITKLGDPQKLVQLAAGRVLTRIAENYPQVILNHPAADEIIKKFTSFLSGNNKLTKYMLWALTHLTEAFRDDDEGKFIKYHEFLIQQFALLTARQDSQDGQLLDVAWAGMINCLQCIKDAKQLKTYLIAFGQQMITVHQQTNWRKESNISGLLSAIHSCFLRLVVLQDICDIQLMNQSYQLVIDYFKKIQTVTQDGFYAISAIIQYSKSNFKLILKDFMQNYLEIGLQKKLEMETFKGAVYCLADIARSIELEDFKCYISILDYLIKCVNDSQVNRNAKISLFVCIADIILVAGTQAEAYFQQVWQLIQSGFNASLIFIQNKDLSQQEYYENLNDALLNCYLCLLHGYNNAQLNQPFIPLLSTLQDLYIFIQSTSEKSLTPTVDYIKLCVSCLLDSVSYYKGIKGQEDILSQIIKSPLLKSLLDMLKTYTDKTEYDSILGYAKDLGKYLNVPPSYLD